MAINLGIIGASGHVHYALQGLTDVPDMRLVAVAPGCEREDLSPLLSNPAVQDHQPTLYEDYNELFARERLDLVAIMPPMYLTSVVCTEALQHGVPALCEKPLSIDLFALDILRGVQQNTGIPLSLLLTSRYEGVFYTARKLVQQGVIGKPIGGYAQKSYKLGERPWFYHQRETFGGIIPWVGIHATDWFQWISGLQYTAVEARHGNRATPQYPGMEDFATCQFDLNSGGSAVMSFDYLRPASAPTHGDDRLRLIGLNGVLEISNNGLEVITSEGARSIPLEESAIGIFADFIKALHDPTHQPLVSTEDAFAVTETALRVREAADSGERVAL